MKPVRLAIIGAGSHAQTHYADPAFQLATEVELCAACDLNRERVESTAARFGVPQTYVDFREMISNEKPDAVVIVLRPMELMDVAFECLALNQHLLVEKPPGCNLLDARRLLAAANKKGLKVMVSLNRRFFPIVRYVRELIKDQPVISCTATYNKAGFVGGAWTWPVSLTLADAIHTVDLIPYFAGKATAVYSGTRRHSAEYVNSTSAVVELASGGLAAINNHQCVGFRKQRFEVHTSRVSAYLDLSDEAEPDVEIYVDGQQLSDDEIQSGMPEPYSEHVDFARWVRGQGTCLAPLQEILETVALAEAVASGHKGPLDSGQQEDR